jgi:hypothetical protein
VKATDLEQRTGSRRYALDVRMHLPCLSKPNVRESVIMILLPGDKLPSRLHPSPMLPAGPTAGAHQIYAVGGYLPCTLSHSADARMAATTSHRRESFAMWAKPEAWDRSSVMQLTASFVTTKVR